MNRIVKLLIAILILSAVILIARQDQPADLDTKTKGPEEKGTRLNGSWTIFRGDATLTGVADVALGDALRLRWTATVGQLLKSSPVVAGGTVYVGSDDGSLVLLDLASGAVRKTVKLGSSIEASPLLADGRVFLGDADGVLHAVSMKDGASLWTYKTEDRILGSANLAPPSTVLVGSYDMHLYAFDAQSGKKRWGVKTENFVNGSPAIWKDHAIFAGCDSFLRGVRLDTGEETFTVEIGSYVAGSVAIAGDTAYLGHYGNEVVAIDLVKQTVKWRYGDPDNGGAFLGSPAVAGGRVVIGSRDTLLHCLDAERGTALWTFRSGGNIDASPVICRDKVVVGGMDGRLVLMRLADGQEVFRYDVGAPLSASPCVIGDAVIVSTEDGRVMLFESVR